MAKSQRKSPCYKIRNNVTPTLSSHITLSEKIMHLSTIITGDRLHLNASLRRIQATILVGRYLLNLERRE